MKIAVIGSGISGNSVAWALSKTHDVTVYEKRNRLGGHSATVDVEYDGVTIPVDTGFIVYNASNYPNLIKLFKHLEVKTEASDMEFSVSLDNGNLEWKGGKRLSGVFAQPSNILSPGFLKMLRDIFRFNKRARLDLQSGALCGLTFDDYLNKTGFSKRLKNDYLVPMTSAIWSTPSAKMLEFPAESLIQFMKNHSLIQSDRPKWRTVSGGSREYVSKLVNDTKAEFRTSSEVVRVERTSGGVSITDANGNMETYDQVVMGSHSDQSLSMLKDASPEEHDILSSVQYVKNDVWLHSDVSLMPKRKKAWAAWNYIGRKNVLDDRDVSVTYWMNKLQNIDEKYPLFVTLNPLTAPDPATVINRYQYAHPLFNAEAIEAQRKLETIQGKNGIWFCGAWTGFGFHEDGLKSGLNVARKLGGIVPWEEPAYAEQENDNSQTAMMEAAE
jgi:predicted NAD/FAD-binding protein